MSKPARFPFMLVLAVQCVCKINYLLKNLKKSIFWSILKEHLCSMQVSIIRALNKSINFVGSIAQNLISQWWKYRTERHFYCAFAFCIAYFWMCFLINNLGIVLCANSMRSFLLFFCFFSYWIIVIMDRRRKHAELSFRSNQMTDCQKMHELTNSIFDRNIKWNTDKMAICFCSHHWKIQFVNDFSIHYYLFCF